MIYFRPFLGEILVGKISSSNEKGIRVSIGFFDDIFIPSYLLQTPSEYCLKYAVPQWVWKYTEESDFMFSVGSMIRLKVRTINFTKITSTAKGLESTTVSEFHSHQQTTDLESSEPVLLRHRSSSLSLDDATSSAPMQIIAAVNEDGLGLVEWWNA